MNKAPLLLSSLTATAIFSLLFIELAPANRSQKISEPMTTLNQIKKTEVSKEEMGFTQQQLDDIDSTTNTYMMVDY